MPPRPISPYGVSKLCAENYCEVYRSIYGLDTVVLRYFTVYGPRMRPDLAISAFTRDALACIVLVILLHGVLAIKSTATYLLGPQPPHFDVSTQYGSLHLWNETEARDINGLIAYIDKNTREGDYIFVTPWDSPLSTS